MNIYIHSFDEWNVYFFYLSKFSFFSILSRNFPFLQVFQIFHHKKGLARTPSVITRRRQMTQSARQIAARRSFEFMCAAQCVRLFAFEWRSLSNKFRKSFVFCSSYWFFCLFSQKGLFFKLPSKKIIPFANTAAYRSQMCTVVCFENPTQFLHV